ncbi:MAG: SRPBCC family protein [Leptospirales bacterium]
MGKLEIQQSYEVNTNAAKAWGVIGPDFVNIADWARGIQKSWENESVSKKQTNAPAGGRFCDLGSFGIFDERIIHFDEKKHEISWNAHGEKLPKFVSGLQNALRVEKIDADNCRISSNITADVQGLKGFLLGKAIQQKFAKQIKGFMSDWKTYAETGEISDKKKSEISKLANSK